MLTFFPSDGDLQEMVDVVEHHQLFVKIEKAFPDCDEEECLKIYENVLRCVGNKRYVCRSVLFPLQIFNSFPLPCGDFIPKWQRHKRYVMFGICQYFRKNAEPAKAEKELEANRVRKSPFAIPLLHLRFSFSHPFCIERKKKERCCAQFS